MARPRMFEQCPECGAEALYVRSTKQFGHCINRWCECKACGAHVRYVKCNGSGFWTRVQKNMPETPPKD